MSVYPCLIRNIFAVISLASLFILSGCWDKIEISDIGIVTATGLELTDDDQVKLSVELVKPQAGFDAEGGGDEKDERHIEAATGKTIFDARQKMHEIFSRRLFWGHDHVVVIGPQMVKSGIQPYIDFFARHPFTRLRSFVFVTKDKKPLDILKAHPQPEVNFGLNVRDLVQRKTGMSVTLKNLFQMLEDESGSAALPVIDTIKTPMDKTEIQMDGTAILKQGIKKDDVDQVSTQGILWIRDENKNATVIIQPTKSNRHISFNQLDSQTNLVPRIQDGNWQMNIHLDASFAPVENETELDLMDAKTNEQLQKEVENKLEKQMETALQTVQTDMEADIFGFGEAFNRHYPNQWKKVKGEWEKKFPEVEVDFSCNVNIDQPGRNTSPHGNVKDEKKDEVENQ